KQATLQWHGVIAAMDTPLTEDGSDLNLGALPALLRFLKEAGLAGVFVGGSTGLGPLLSLEQREAVTEATVAAADGLTVLVHVGAERTADAVRLAQHAAQAGAGTDLGFTMAAATVAFIPLLIIFLAFQKYFIRGITMGSIKG